MSKLLNQMLCTLIHIYRLFLSPIMPGNCRYLPSCSNYGLEALHVYGPCQGSWLTLKRLVRCNPWGGYGHDPVPPVRPPTAARHPADRHEANL